jgi:hypothetical protein
LARTENWCSINILSPKWCCAFAHGEHNKWFIRQEIEITLFDSSRRRVEVLRNDLVADVIRLFDNSASLCEKTVPMDLPSAGSAYFVLGFSARDQMEPSSIITLGQRDLTDLVTLSPGDSGSPCFWVADG